MLIWIITALLAIIRAGIGHHHGNDQPSRVDQDMSLAPCDLLVAIKPDVFVLGRRLDALGVYAASGGLGLASQTASLPLVARKSRPIKEV